MLQLTFVILLGKGRSFRDLDPPCILIFFPSAKDEWWYLIKLIILNKILRKYCYLFPRWPRKWFRTVSIKCHVLLSISLVLISSLTIWSTCASIDTVNREQSARGVRYKGRLVTNQLVHDLCKYWELQCSVSPELLHNFVVTWFAKKVAKASPWAKVPGVVHWSGKIDFFCAN